MDQLFSTPVIQITAHRLGEHDVDTVFHYSGKLKMINLIMKPLQPNMRLTASKCITNWKQ